MSFKNGNWTRPILLGATVAFALCLCGAGVASAQDAAAGAGSHAAAVEAGSEHTFDRIPGIWWIAPIGALLALVFAWIFYGKMIRADEGDEDMKTISSYVRDGALAYLRQQYKVVAVFFFVVSVLLFIMGWFLHVQHQIVFAAFLTGGFWSGLCGWLGMNTATRASHRTTAGARKSLNDGLVVAFRSGAVMGLVVVGFGLVDIAGWFLLLYSDILPFDFAKHMSLNEITVVMLTFGMGASSQALFARVGGGIYTKAADVGADLVGKVEAGIPEDDPRNPATIADNVGDNVGDVAGMGADLFESYCGSILATAALGVAAVSALYTATGGAETGAGFNAALRMLAMPMVMAGIGIVLSIVGIYMVRTKEDATMGQLLNALRTGIYGSSILIAIAAAVICNLLLDGITGVSPWGIWGAIMAGLVAGNVIGYATEYYTSYEFKPTRKIAEQAITGPATVIIAGIATGMRSTWASLTTIIAAILVAFISAGGTTEFLLGLYGVGIAAVGMLATLGITLATDAYGPIADNAGGNAEMTGQEPHVRDRTDALDSLGNTTAATGKGFAIGSAALTALALLAAYVEEVRIGQIREARAEIIQTVEAANEHEAIYFGHGKLAMHVGEGTGDSDFDCLMVLEPHPIPTALKPETKIAWTGEPDEENVIAATFEEQPIRLVSARKASLAQYMQFYNVTLMNPKTLCGMFSGVLLVFLFCSMTMQAVGRAANSMMLECRNQFNKVRAYLRAQGHDEEYVNNSDNWPRKQIVHEGEKIPDYSSAVAISTKGAQREMIIPSLLAIIVPVLAGLLFDVPGVMGLLAGGLTSGFAVAIFMANAGGAWDNAKKWIETYGKITARQVADDEGNVRSKLPAAIRADLVARAEAAVKAGRPNAAVYGKGSDDHKAGIVGDTVGDPFKDTSGPSLNILIKLMSMVSVVFAGLIVKFGPQIGGWLGLD
ncbi:MAG: sodium-translocating pyrophosphatase [Phycisphaerae bacterium]|nr:sodium-translocating pyrophosphatase [Phycisphaerae bacterium]